MISQEYNTPGLPARELWPPLLVLAPREHLERTVAELLSQLQHPDAVETVEIREARSGLALLQIRDGVEDEAFNLGEIPVARVVVDIHLPDGSRASGAAEILADDPSLAKMIAICDALLANHPTLAHPVRDLLCEGQRRVRERDQFRQTMLNHTRVDFSLLNQESE